MKMKRRERRKKTADLNADEKHDENWKGLYFILTHQKTGYTYTHETFNSLFRFSLVFLHLYEK